MQCSPVLLLILDGWGYSENHTDNAIAQADTPVWDHLWADYPHTLIGTSGPAVGLPQGQMGNSEVGHMNLGAGRVVYQDFTRITQAVEQRQLSANGTLCDSIDSAVTKGRAVHLMGLLSDGGVHSHQLHIEALVRLAAERGAERIYCHAFLDGRDTPPKSASASLQSLERVFAEIGRGRIASIIGRYYAMDRDARWDRVASAYRLLSEGCGEYSATTADQALLLAYARNETDEFVKATTVGEPAPMADGDCVIFANFRADRARELTQALVEPDFDDFDRSHIPKLAAFVCLTQYYEGVPAAVAFAPESLDDSLGQVVAEAGLRQLRIAETEKYAHVTFFFNGGRETVFANEDRTLVPSPKVATYDLQPEMSAEELTDRLVEAISSGGYGLIVCNYANPDMVGHTGKFEPAVRAVETVDRCLGRIAEAIRAAGGEMLITADHGNLEQMRDPQTNQPHTAHTTNPVPLVYVGRAAELAADGALCDVAPTLLQLMGLAQPRAMLGRSLVQFV